VKVKTLEKEDLSELGVFCIKCQVFGYENNSSLKAMKYEWCKEWGEYWGAFVDKRLVAVAGAHPLPEVGPNAMRVLFRGCQVDELYKGLGKYHMNSIPFRDILPYQIAAYPDKDLYITTNVTHDASGRMNRTHRVMKLLDKLDIVQYNGNMELYYTEQSVWKLNVEKYNEVRRRLETSK
jgi:hypothetical protein